MITLHYQEFNVVVNRMRRITRSWCPGRLRRRVGVGPAPGRLLASVRSQERHISLTYSVIMNVTTIPQLVRARRSPRKFWHRLPPGPYFINKWSGARASRLPLPTSKRNKIGLFFPRQT